MTVDTNREPWGVVLIVGPGNYPLLLPGVQAVQGVAAGNAVLWKPGRGGLEVARLFSELCIKAGCPSDALRVLSEEAGDVHCALSAGVDHVVLTGSTESGRAVLRACAETLTPATVELSGCDAVFVDATADVTIAARAVAFGLTFNGSATCIAPRRVFVHATVASQFMTELQRLLAMARVKPVDEHAAATARTLIHEALDAGGRILSGHLSSTNHWQPLILTDVPADAPIIDTDLFVPVCTLSRVASMSTAIEANKRCRYALSAAVFAAPDVASDIARKLPVGCVTINDLIAPTADPRVSFTGWKQSGYGSTRGPEGLRQMTRVKTVVTQRSRFRPHLDPARPATVGLLQGLLEFTHARRWSHRLAGLRRLWRTINHGNS